MINEHSRSRTKIAISEVENRFSLSKFDLVNIGINNTYSEASTPDYLEDPFENRTALFGSYKVHSATNNWNAVVSARQEFIKNKEIPFTPSVGFEGKLIKFFIVKGNFSKHYRLPTFNDLYWAGQGAKGNSKLKPESGWAEELSLIHRSTYRQLDWELGATGFSRIIDDWIIWLPDQYNSWTPANVLQVWSRGLEYKVKVNYAVKKFKVQLSGMYNYILSTNERSTTANDAAIGKQLIYVPMQNAQGNLTISYKATSFSYTQVYTGYRYTSSDNIYFLKPYAVGNLNIAQTFGWNTLKIKAYAQLNNVWKETYQVIAYRAMPLFNFQFGLTVYFNQRKKNS